MRSVLAVCCLALLAAAVTPACSSSKNDTDPSVGYHPPPPLANPRTCGEVRSGGEVQGKRDIAVGGEQADCQVDRAMCSLADIASFDGVCPSGAPYAYCQATRWVVYCMTLEGGVDGSDGASEDSGAPDAAGD